MKQNSTKSKMMARQMRLYFLTMITEKYISAELVIPVSRSKSKHTPCWKVSAAPDIGGAAAKGLLGNSRNVQICLWHGALQDTTGCKGD